MEDLSERDVAVRDISLQEMSREELLKTLREVGSSTMSVSIGILLTSIQLTVNLMFAGKLREDSILSGIGMANIMLNFSGAYMMGGLNQGFGTLAARAVGIKSRELLFDQFAKCLLTMAIVSVFFSGLVWKQDDILNLLGQDPMVSMMASKYSKQMLLGFVFMFLFDCMRNYLNALGEFHAPMQMQALGLGLQIILDFIFIDFFGMGLEGITLSMNISFIFQFCLIIWKTRQMNSIPNLNSVKLFREYSKYCSIVFPIAMPMVLDIFCFEINSLLIGSLHVESAFSAHVILCNIVSIFYSVPLGLGAAICTLISNAVGQNRSIIVKNYYHLTLFGSFTIGLFYFVILIFFTNSLGLMFTSDADTLEQFSAVSHVYVIFVIIDIIQCSIQGVLKGIGMGEQCLKIFVLSYYVVGTPLSCLFGFVFEMGLIGFWIGFCISLTTIFLAALFLLQQTHFHDAVTLEHQRVLHSKSLFDADLDCSLNPHIQLQFII